MDSVPYYSGVCPTIAALQAQLKEKPIRTCRMTGHKCCICWFKIKPGHKYFDGGINRRAHTWCVEGIPK